VEKTFTVGLTFLAWHIARYVLKHYQKLHATIEASTLTSAQKSAIYSLMDGAAMAAAALRILTGY
jgi:hypothetical protein